MLDGGCDGVESCHENKGIVGVNACDGDLSCKGNQNSIGDLSW